MLQTEDSATETATDSIRVENPATGRVVATVPVVAPGDVAERVARARRAQPGWEAIGFEGRAAVMKRCRRWVLDNQERVIDTIVSETGKAYEEALIAEIGYAEQAFSFWAGNAESFLADERVRSASPFVKGRKLIVRYAPLGAVGVIGPWNYPLLNSFGDCIPALMAGNSVLLKPSEVTPLTSLLMGEMLRESGLPEDVYQALPGYGETAQALIDEVDYVMFTGSAATGRKVMERAARTLTPVSLELGGKDPMIVLSDADLERAANAAVHYSMQNAGQSCTSTERVYVEEPIYDRFVEMVAERVRGLRQGEPHGPGSTDLGAVINPPQSDILERHVKEAVEQGARVLVGGGRRDENGHYFEPTVLVDVDHSMACMREESFGPTVPIMKVRDTEEAVRLRLTLTLLILSVPAVSAYAQLPIDDYAYDRASRCVKQPTPGALALVRWLEKNARGTSWGIMRCEKWGRSSASLHAEGRAVDWHLDAARAADRREARRLIDLWLAADDAGNEHALARRMGIQEIIWNCRSWWSGADAMGEYSACYTERGKRRTRMNRTEAHMDHIHIGLSRAGARKRTSFWAH